MIGRVVVRIDIHNVPTGIVVILVVRRFGYTPRFFGGGEVPVFGKINHMQPGRLRVVRRMITVAVEQRVLRGALCTQPAAIVLTLLPARRPVGVRGAHRTFHLHQIIPARRTAVPGIVAVLSPRVVERTQARLPAVKNIAVTRTNLRKHIERRAAAFVCRFSSGGCKCRHKSLVERQAGYMSAGIDTKTVHTHPDERRVALYKVVIYCRILSIQIHTVAGNLCKPAIGFIPVEVPVVVPVVVRIVVFLLSVLVRRVFHLRQSCRVLTSTVQIGIVVRQQTAFRNRLRNHTFVQRTLVGTIVALKQLAQVSLAEVTRVVEHNIQNDLHSALVHLVNQCLELHVFRLVAMIHFGKIHGVVTVIIISRSVLHHRRYPYCRESQCLDIIEFLYQSLEVAAPCRIARVLRLVIPTLGIVRRITVIESCGDNEIDLLVAKIRTRRKQRGCHCRQHCQQAKEYECRVFHIKTRYYWLSR